MTKFCYILPELRCGWHLFHFNTNWGSRRPPSLSYLNLKFSIFEGWGRLGGGGGLGGKPHLPNLNSKSFMRSFHFRRSGKGKLSVKFEVPVVHKLSTRNFHFRKGGKPSKSKSFRTCSNQSVTGLSRYGSASCFTRLARP